MTCHVENFPGNLSDLYWTFNNERIVAATVIDNYSFHNVSQRPNEHRRRLLRDLKYKRHYFADNNNKEKSHVSILNSRSLNMTRLRISKIQSVHKGLYACRYGKEVTEYHLSFDSEGKFSYKIMFKFCISITN